MRILVVEDDLTFGDILKRVLVRERYTVDTASDGEEAVYKAKVNSYALILLDIKLPKKNGFEICRILRRAGKTTPILMITAVSEEFGAATGLDLGADDYLRKPFELNELLARVRALLRRKNGNAQTSVKYGTISLDTRGHRVFYKDKEEINLNPKEYKLLNLFLNHIGEAVSTSEIVENVWGEDLSDINSNSLEVYIHRLRKVLEKCELKGKLATVRGFGYKLEKLK